ncbi:aldo/keto reductase [Sandaracinobacteroides saxicola]|uniref:Aldo/keto reductase n=1 Tax=Sandaracinobacteroides saxicola TaxID=2759707 RepID=A0A7G5IMH3_9SPHN|nr:aldo/keto reductase [Sandaracinobacteroides saxicola]
MGCAAFGNLYAPVADVDAEAAMAAAIDVGVRHFDTAPYYGHGLSESRLGAFLRATGHDVILSSKVGRSLAEGEAPGDTGFVGAACARPYFDYGRDAVLRQVEGSLRRLGRERLDMLFVHDIGALVHGADHPARFQQALDGAFPALAELKAQGVVDAIGIGVNEVAVCLETLAAVEIDLILLAGRYTLLEQAALDDLLPLCAARGVGVIVGGPFNSGVLAGGDHYDYGAVPAAIGQRVERLRRVGEAHGVPLAAAALQFPLAAPAVCSVIPGARSAAEVRANTAAMAHAIPADYWAALKAEGLLRADAPVPA